MPADRVLDGTVALVTGASSGIGEATAIRELRAAGKKLGLAGSGERARAALELAGVADLFPALLIGVARNLGTPEDLRQAGADMVVADLQELLGSAKGLDR
jgi:NAD(P)-dependent dehydrogenase (short-subunit alcohol dehydrogenase family)